MKRLWKTKLPAFLLAMVMVIGMIPAAFAASSSTTISYTVEAGDYEYFDKDKFGDLFDSKSVYDSYFNYLEFYDVDGMDDYGYVCAKDYYGDEDALDEDDLDGARFYWDKNDVTNRSGRYFLDGINFEAKDKAKSGTVYLYFTMRGDRDDVDGVLKVTVGGDDADSISYSVKAGDQVSFDADDFYDFFEENYSSSTRSLRYVIFEKPSSSTFSDGTLYYNYGKSSQVAFTRNTLNGFKFYYDDANYGDYSLDKLTFVADKTFSDDIELTFKACYDESRYVSGTVEIASSGKSSSSKGDIQMEVDPDDYVDFDEDDFNDYFREEYNYDFKYLVFTDSDNLNSSTGYVYYNYGRSSKVRFTASSLENAYFYYDEDDIGEDDEDCYPLEDLSFVAASGFDGTVTLEFRAYYSTSRYVDGTVTITSTESSGSSAKGDITYEVKAGSETAVDEDDFDDYVKDETSRSNTLKYLVFTDSENLNSYNGYFYYNYGRSSQVRFTASSLENAYFYYDGDDIDEDDEDCYPLEDLSFVASSSFNTYVTLEFRAYYSSSKYVDGTVVFDSKSGSSTTKPSTYYVGNIRYATTPGTHVQINANDISRFFSKMCPGYTMQYVLLTGVPSTGSLYYNYYNTSKYGTASRAQITSYNASGQVFYASPSSTSQYALTELTYVPSGTNYCAAIPFTAYGTGSRAVSGAILISVTSTAVAEVYGATPKNTTVNFPTSSIYNAVLGATGSALSSIQLLSLPSYTAGVVYAGSELANTTTQYTYSSGTNSMSQLRFVPTTGYTGSVEIPYVALNSSGTAIASGTFSLGVVNSVKKFSDVTSSTWCYKYVAELSDAGVISGYSDGSFKPNNTVTYGAALKLIMLAAGYPEQKPTGSNVFSGYLDKARAEGIITKSNIDLSKPITRLQMAQLAAGALKLDTSNLSSVQPFTDTTDASVRALNAAGIVEGYFSNGTSTFKPNNTLTRGQVSAIVWRMQNYRK